MLNERTSSSNVSEQNANSIKIRKIGIAELDTDAIVNAANGRLWAGRSLRRNILRGRT